MAKVVREHFSFDRGIDQVVRGSPDPVRLPVQYRLLPADLAGTPQLERLLARQNIDDYLVETLRPVIDDLEILAPSRFRQVLAKVTATLQQAADAEDAQAHPVAPALKVLAEEEALRDLFQSYRAALLAG